MCHRALPSFPALCRHPPCALNPLPPPRTCNGILLQVVGPQVLGLELLPYRARRLIKLLLHVHLRYNAAQGRASGCYAAAQTTHVS